MTTWLHDLRLAIRGFLRRPAFSLAAVLTMALGVGATAAIVTVVDRIILRPLPFPDSERVVMLCETNARVGDYCVASPANVADWAATVPALAMAGVGRSESSVVRLDGHTIGVPAGIASAGFLKALGARVSAGRLLTDEDLNPSRNHVVVVTNSFWREHLGARASAVGEFMTLDNLSYQIVGVLAPDTYVPTFDFVQMWRPLTTSVDDTSRREWRGFMAVGKMAPGADDAMLARQLETTRARLAREYPAANEAWRLRVKSIREHVVGSTALTLWMFAAAVGLVLAMACMNVAGLMLVRASSRASEFSLRAALGAGRSRVIRQLLAESAVIAIAGSAGGWVLAVALTRALVAFAPPDIPRLDEVHPDAPIAWFVVGLTALTTVLFGLAPARAASRVSAVEALSQSRLVSSSHQRGRMWLVGVELTLCVMLMLGAGVLLQSFVRMLKWNPGFERARLSVSWLVVPSAQGQTIQRAVEVLERAREAVAAIPGVTAVGLASGGPLFGGTESSVVERLETKPQAEVVSNWLDVDPHYFSALGRRVVRGRDLATADNESSDPVAVVNETFARRVFGDAEPIGQRVVVQNHPALVVGVAADVSPTRPDRSAVPEIFWPIRQYPRRGAYLVVRTAIDVPDLERLVRERVTAEGLQPGALVPIERSFQRSLVSPRFTMLVIMTFAIAAILLAAVGLYGMLANTVALRRREIGLRIALGASPQQLVREIAGGIAVLASVSALLGLAISTALGRVLSSWLYGLSPVNPVAVTGTLIGIVLLAAAASYVPVRRALRIDPLVALKAEP